MSVTNEQLLETINEMRADLHAQVKDNAARILSIERSGVPAICGDKETRLRKVETRTLLWSGKAALLGAGTVIFLCGIASAFGAWIVAR